MKRIIILSVIGLVAIYSAYLLNHFSSTPVEKKDSPVPVVITPVALPVPRPEKQVAKVKKAPIKRNTEFSQVTEKAWARLPRMEEIKEKGRRDFHYAPPELMEIAEDLGKINDQMERDARLIPQGTAFLKKCALEDGVMSAARAVCLRNLKYWSKNTSLDMSVFPDDIKRLSQSLPETP